MVQVFLRPAMEAGGVVQTKWNSVPHSPVRIPGLRTKAKWSAGRKISFQLVTKGRGFAVTTWKVIFLPRLRTKAKCVVGGKISFQLVVPKSVAPASLPARMPALPAGKDASATCRLEASGTGRDAYATVVRESSLPKALESSEGAEGK
jgi:hypothetical protein